MKTHEPYVRVLNAPVVTEAFTYDEGTLGVVISFVSTRQVNFMTLFESGKVVTVTVPVKLLNTPSKQIKVMCLTAFFQVDPVLAVRATMHQQIVRLLIEKLVKENIVVSKNDRCFGLLESAIQKKAIGRGVAVHFMDTLRGQLSEKKRMPTVFSLN